MPGYAATPLIEVPALAELLGAGSVWVKDESNRFGLPAFKVLGASWAVNRALGPAQTFDELVSQVAGRAGRRITLVTATDGSHGRALAYLARALGLRPSPGRWPLVRPSTGPAPAAGYGPSLSSAARTR
ncbi:pyridoxal-phosphate dependent enzyme [Kribbella sindirgiensis]|uniref:Pyridoxal-phosphate dependent enzyme n=2 Tax=Kribbella sindirgiensis TaxID=1124744 RepID=A0A4R0IDK2_9ACTN|nr:pyridoxal-phosphate dependent enzyme [Kribbella sindirgiensis]